MRTLAGPKGGVTSVAFSPDGKAVASGSEDNTVWVWDVQSGTVLRTLAKHEWGPRHSCACTALGEVAEVPRTAAGLGDAGARNLAELIGGQKKAPKRCCLTSCPEDKVGHFGAR